MPKVLHDLKYPKPWEYDSLLYLKAMQLFECLGVGPQHLVASILPRASEVSVGSGHRAQNLRDKRNSLEGPSQRESYSCG